MEMPQSGDGLGGDNEGRGGLPPPPDASSLPLTMMGERLTSETYPDPVLLGERLTSETYPEPASVAALLQPQHPACKITTDDFECLHVIGQGGFGKVLLVRLVKQTHTNKANPNPNPTYPNP
jgi:hypothetical protein